MNEATNPLAVETSPTVQDILIVAYTGITTLLICLPYTGW